MPCKKNLRFVDTDGRARAGSQRQIQTWVNELEVDFSQRVLGVLDPSAGPDARLRWVSPLANDMFNEYQDAEFLDKLGLSKYSDELSEFWPKGGPCWDGLAVVDALGHSGILLVEAKSHISEMESACRAGGRSRNKIEQALALTAANLGVSVNSCWTGHYYQTANRYAHLHFLRNIARVPAWLLNVYFVGDQRSRTSREEWREALEQVKERMGFRGKPVPFACELFLEAVNAK